MKMRERVIAYIKKYSIFQTIKLYLLNKEMCVIKGLTPDRSLFLLKISH